MNGRLEEGDLAFGFLSRTLDKLPFGAKYGVLVSGDAPQESVAFEIAKSKSKDRGGLRTALTSGWSLDAIATRDRAGLGVAKDLFASHGLELDAGIYATQRYEDIFRGKLGPQLGIGMHVSF